MAVSKAFDFRFLPLIHQIAKNIENQESKIYPGYSGKTWNPAFQHFKVKKLISRQHFLSGKNADYRLLL